MFLTAVAALPGKLRRSQPVFNTIAHSILVSGYGLNCCGRPYHYLFTRLLSLNNGGIESPRTSSTEVPCLWFRLCGALAPAVELQ
jgi:hypothetical protein